MNQAPCKLDHIRTIVGDTKVKFIQEQIRTAH